MKSKIDIDNAISELITTGSLCLEKMPAYGETELFERSLKQSLCQSGHVVYNACIYKTPVGTDGIVHDDQSSKLFINLDDAIEFCENRCDYQQARLYKYFSDYPADSNLKKQKYCCFSCRLVKEFGFKITPAEEPISLSFFEFPMRKREEGKWTIETMMGHVLKTNCRCSWMLWDVANWLNKNKRVDQKIKPWEVIKQNPVYKAWY